MNFIWKGGIVLKTVLLVILFWVGLVTYAQSSPSTKKVTLTCENVPFEQALQRLAQQAGVFFAYSLNFVEANRPVSFSVRNEPVDDVLIRICNQMGLLYKKQGKNVILKKKSGPIPKNPVKKNATPKSVVKNPVNTNTSRDNTAREKPQSGISSPVVTPIDTIRHIVVADSTQSEDTIAVVDTLGDSDTLLVVEMQRVVKRSDTITDSQDSVLSFFLFRNNQPTRRVITSSRVYSYKPRAKKDFAHGDALELFLFGNREDSEPLDTLQSDSLTLTKNSLTKKRSPGKRYRNSSDWNFGNSNFIVGAGLYLNEITRFGVILQVGIRSAFGIFDLGVSNNEITRKAVGIGGVWSLGTESKWSVGAEITTAKVRKSEKDVLLKNMEHYSYPYPYPFYKADIEWISWHHRLNAIVRWQIKKNLEIEVSPTFNWLTTRYKINGKSAPVQDLVLFPSNSWYYSNTILPPYLFRDKNSDSKPVPRRGELDFRNTQLWFGIQAGIFYTIDFSSQK